MNKLFWLFFVLFVIIPICYFFAVIGNYHNVHDNNPATLDVSGNFSDAGYWGSWLLLILLISLSALLHSAIKHTLNDISVGLILKALTFIYFFVIIAATAKLAIQHDNSKVDQSIVILLWLYYIALCYFAFFVFGHAKIPQVALPLTTQMARIASRMRSGLPEATAVPTAFDYSNIRSMTLFGKSKRKKRRTKRKR